VPQQEAGEGLALSAREPGSRPKAVRRSRHRPLPEDPSPTHRL
jgi:hypothetical protein